MNKNDDWFMTYFPLFLVGCGVLWLLDTVVDALKARRDVRVAELNNVIEARRLRHPELLDDMQVERLPRAKRHVPAED